MKLYKFNLQTPPLFYVCGSLDITEKWKHKHMYQKGNYEIIFVLKGMIYIEISGTQHIIKENEYFIVPPYHNMQGFRESPIGTKMIWIHFFPHKLNNYATDPYYQATIPEQATMFHTDHIIVLAHQVLDQSVEKNQLMTDLSVAQLLAFMSLDFAEFQKQNKKNPAMTSVIKNWIDAHIGDIERVSDVSDRFNFNEIYLNRIFKDEYGTSIYQYFIDARIKHAESLLVSTDKTIFQISQESFFHDDKNFSKIFKKKTGLTPSKYRTTFRKRFINTPSVDPEIEVPDQIKNRLKTDK